MPSKSAGVIVRWHDAAGDYPPLAPIRSDSNPAKYWSDSTHRPDSACTWGRRRRSGIPAPLSHRAYGCLPAMTVTNWLPTSEIQKKKVFYWSSLIYQPRKWTGNNAQRLLTRKTGNTVKSLPWLSFPIISGQMIGYFLWVLLIKSLAPIHCEAGFWNMP